MVAVASTVVCSSSSGLLSSVAVNQVYIISRHSNIQVWRRRRCSSQVRGQDEIPSGVKFMTGRKVVPTWKIFLVRVCDAILCPPTTSLGDIFFLMLSLDQT